MPDPTKSWLVGGAVIAALFLVARLVASSADRPERPEVVGGLEPCPGSPNCVSSTATDPAHQVAPLAIEGDGADAFARLRDTLVSLGGKEVRAGEGYLWFEFRTPVFGFIDDLECLLRPGATHIEIRSASRLGHSDLGKNRKRVEQLRKAFSTRAS